MDNNELERLNIVGMKLYEENEIDRKKSILWTISSAFGLASLAAFIAHVIADISDSKGLATIMKDLYSCTGFGVLLGISITQDEKIKNRMNERNRKIEEIKKLINGEKVESKIIKG